MGGKNMPVSLSDPNKPWNELLFFIRTFTKTKNDKLFTRFRILSEPWIYIIVTYV